MDYKLLIIQTIGFIGTFFYLISFQFKNNKTLFRAQFISYIFYSLHFFLLGAFTGGLSYLVCLTKSFCLSSNNKILHSKTICIILCIAQIIVGIITYQGLISILPIIANVAAIIAGYSGNARNIRLVGVFINSPLWIAHNLYVGSLAGVIDELITEISIIVSIYRYGFNKENGEK